jgi:hypothetical protein
VAYLYSLTTRRSPKTLHPPHGALGYLGRNGELVRARVSRARVASIYNDGYSSGLCSMILACDLNCSSSWSTVGSGSGLVVVVSIR